MSYADALYTFEATKDYAPVPSSLYVDPSGLYRSDRFIDYDQEEFKIDYAVCERWAADVNCDSDFLYGLIMMESGGNARIRNHLGSSASGLIQFMDFTALGLDVARLRDADGRPIPTPSRGNVPRALRSEFNAAKGRAIGRVRSMNAGQQMALAEWYFYKQKYKTVVSDIPGSQIPWRWDQPPTFYTLCMMVFYPAYMSPKMAYTKIPGSDKADWKNPGISQPIDYIKAACGSGSLNPPLRDYLRRSVDTWSRGKPVRRLRTYSTPGPEQVAASGKEEKDPGSRSLSAASTWSITSAIADLTPDPKTLVKAAGGAMSDVSSYFFESNDDSNEICDPNQVPEATVNRIQRVVASGDDKTAKSIALKAESPRVSMTNVRSSTPPDDAILAPPPTTTTRSSVRVISIL
jgi:hypothetical protein